MNSSPCTLSWFSRLPSQRCTWPSMIKISSPFFVLYIPWTPLGVDHSIGTPSRPSRNGARVLFFVGERVFHIAEQHDGVVVHHHHSSVMRRGADLKEGRRH